MHVCMHACMYVCMHVEYIYIYNVYIYIGIYIRTFNVLSVYIYIYTCYIIVCSVLQCFCQGKWYEFPGAGCRSRKPWLGEFLP